MNWWQRLHNWDRFERKLDAELRHLLNQQLSVDTH